ncbi:uncharacterized protein [Nicotiana tomentosiformis]|uniref:uncharacterized protein n=1 Tax=Nicotiana tomentosiformis TaxID=4098 RepID=UPI00051BDE70|nr:uncharacterized protein LOC104108575 [Nicotiana tomentosiformis]
MDGEHEYMGWYHSVTRLFVGNPVHRAGDQYIPFGGRHEALAIGLHQFYQWGLQMLQHTGEGESVLRVFGCRVTDLDSDTFIRAREDGRLGYEVAYVLPEEYHHGPPVEPERGRCGRRGQKGRAGPQGHGGRRGRGPQQGGVEAPVENIRDDQPGEHPELHDASHDMSSFSLQLSPGTSQVTPSALLLIAGRAITRQEWDQYFPDPPDPSLVVADWPIQEVHSGR